MRICRVAVPRGFWRPKVQIETMPPSATDGSRSGVRGLEEQLTLPHVCKDLLSGNMGSGELRIVTKRPKAREFAGN